MSELRLEIQSRNHDSMGWRHFICVYGHPTVPDGTAFASALEDVHVEAVISYINGTLHSRQPGKGIEAADNASSLPRPE